MKYGFAVAALALAASLGAQSYQDLKLVRQRPPQYSSVLEVRVGAAASVPEEKDETQGYESIEALDGHVYYHNDRFSSEAAVLDAYAGRDGAYIGMRQDGRSGNASRIELDYRFKPFYREGFYRRGDFIPTARYEGVDYGGYLGFGRTAADGLTVEIGPYIRQFDFEANENTDPSYILPDDYRAYGIRTFAEHNTLQLDRQTGRPAEGFILTLRIEAERNDSKRSFGTPSFTSRLPSTLWRGRAHLEWYLPQRDLGTWEVRVDGNWSDEDDRIANYDAQTPIGNMWVDGDIGIRWDFGGLAIAPFAKAQWVRALREDGSGKEEEFFFGGGARLRLDVGEQSALSFYADYSYLQNPSRAPVSTIEDALGEHQFFVGLELRIGGKRY